MICRPYNLALIGRAYIEFAAIADRAALAIVMVPPDEVADYGLMVLNFQSLFLLGHFFTD